MIPLWLDLLFRDFSTKDEGLIAGSSESLESVEQEITYHFKGSLFSISHGNFYDLFVVFNLDPQDKHLLLFACYDSADHSVSSEIIRLSLPELTLRSFKLTAFQLFEQIKVYLEQQDNGNS